MLTFALAMQFPTYPNERSSAPRSFVSRPIRNTWFMSVIRQPPENQCAGKRLFCFFFVYFHEKILEKVHVDFEVLVKIGNLSGIKIDCEKDETAAFLFVYFIGKITVTERFFFFDFCAELCACAAYVISAFL